MARNIFARFTRRQPKADATLDGPALKRLFTAGFHWLERHKEYINALNVYPVPDGDTGKNMTLTLAAAVKATASDAGADASASAFMEAFSRGALMGARGNSGSILSQSLRGFSKAIAGKDRLTPADFAAALQEGARSAYECVEKPVEGTILTVAREAAEAAVRASERPDITFPQLLDETVRAGKVAVERTPDQLQKLKDAGVVDAGGQGYITVYEGVMRALKGEPVEPLTHAEREAMATGQKGSVEIEEEFGYEVVFLLRGENLDIDGIRRTINAMGGVSTVVAGDGQMLKVHTHVPLPGKVLDYGVSLGSLIDINIENLQEQSLEYARASAQERGLTDLDVHSAASATGNGGQPAAPPVERLEVGVVAVAAGDGWARLFASYRLGGVVPGGQTMNPSVEDLLRAVEACPSDNVILLPNNHNIFMSARQVNDLTTKQVRVVPSDSMPQGMAALLAFNHQADFEANAAAMERALTSVTSGEVTRAVRAATIDGLTVSEGDLMGLADGKLVVKGQDLEHVTHDLLTTMDAAGHEIITLFPGEETSAADAEAMTARIRTWFPNQEVETQRGDQPHYAYIIAVE